LLVDELQIDAYAGRKCGRAPAENDRPDEQHQFVDHAADTTARRSPSEVRLGLEQSFGLLEEAWDALDDAQWGRQAIMTAGVRSMVEIVSHHLRNVEVHHVDLGIG
jgi:hypothetical protein